MPVCYRWRLVRASELVEPHRGHNVPVPPPSPCKLLQVDHCGVHTIDNFCCEPSSNPFSDVAALTSLLWTTDHSSRLMTWKMARRQCPSSPWQKIYRVHARPWMRQDMEW